MPWYLIQLMKRGGVAVYRDKADDGTGSGGSGGGGGGGNGGSDPGPDDKGGTKNDGDPTGKSSLSDKEAALLSEVMEKKNKLKEATAQLEQANARLAAFDGLDPAEIRKLVEEQKARQTAELEAKGEWEAVKKQMVEAHAAEKTASQQALEAERAEKKALNDRIAELTVGNAFGNSKFIATTMHLPPAKARVLFGGHFEFDGEKVVGYDKPAGAAGRAQLVDAQGQPLSFEAALEKLVRADPDAENLLKSEIKSGAASGTEKGAAAPKNDPQLFGRARIAAALRAAKK